MKAPSFKGLRPSSANASRVMRANKSQNTLPEIKLRRELRKLGLRSRSSNSKVVGRPDFVFRSVRVAVFCDGDFWHGRLWRVLRQQLRQRHNSAYWIAMIARNRQRDRINSKVLQQSGWHVLRFRETEIKRDAKRIAVIVEQCVRARARTLNSARRSSGTEEIGSAIPTRASRLDPPISPTEAPTFNVIGLFPSDGREESRAPIAHRR